MSSQTTKVEAPAQRQSATLEGAGATISRTAWGGHASASELDPEARMVVAEGQDIKYAVFKKGTVVTAGMKDDDGSNHVSSWPIAYAIDGVMDWLFAQTASPR